MSHARRTNTFIEFIYFFQFISLNVDWSILSHLSCFKPPFILLPLAIPIMYSVHRTTLLPIIPLMPTKLYYLRLSVIVSISTIREHATTLIANYAI